MNIKKAFLNTALVLVTAGTLAACSQDSDESHVKEAMSDAGDTVEQAMDDTGDAVAETIDNAGDALNDAGDATEDALTDAGNAVEDACEEVKEETGAENTNC